MQEKLYRKGFPAHEIEAALKWIEAEGWLDEDRYCEHYLQARAQKGIGPLKLLSELLKKGLDQSLITNQLKQMDMDWNKLAKKVAESKFNLNHEVKDHHARIARFLMSRGFTTQHIIEALKTEQVD